MRFEDPRERNRERALRDINALVLAQSTRHRCLSARGRFPVLWAFLLFLGVSGMGCAGTSYRLTENFDSEAPGTVPPAFPAPTPPEDGFNWNQNELQPTVVPRDVGGKWVRIQAKDSYLSLPGPKKAQVLLAQSERLKKTGANFRGHVLLRLVGHGEVVIRVTASRGESGPPPPGFSHDFIGGLLVTSFPTSEIVTLTRSDLESRREPPTGTQLMRYTSEQTVELFWSVNQAARVLNLSVASAGTTDSRQLPYTPHEHTGVPFFDTAIVFVDVYDFNLDTRLFIDDLSVEELK